VFQANLGAAMEVFNLLKPALLKSNPAMVAQIQQRYDTVESAITKYKAAPGYDNTGYVEYSTVLDPSVASCRPRSRRSPILVQDVRPSQLTTATEE